MTMRCYKVRRLVISEGAARSPELDQHLGRCGACAAYARDWERLRTSFQKAAAEPAPEPSFGFAARLIRLLPGAAAEARAREVSVERTGRRFVLAGLLAAVLLVLGLLVPPSGPVRSPEAAEIQTSRVEATAAQNYPLFSNQAIEGEYEFAPVGGGH
jgi:anti-sigma factor RsiW